MTEKEKTSIAKEYFKDVWNSLESTLDDTIYDTIDPSGKYGDELLKEFNLDTIREVLELGFVTKYGTCLGI